MPFKNSIVKIKQIKHKKSNEGFKNKLFRNFKH